MYDRGLEIILTTLALGLATLLLGLGIRGTVVALALLGTLGEDTVKMKTAEDELNQVSKHTRYTPCSKYCSNTG